LQLIEFEKDVVGLLGNRAGAVDFAVRADELKRFQETSTEVALVASRIHIATRRALAFDKSIREKRMVLFTVELGCDPLFQVTILLEF
jgi:hypothetical protein